MRIYLIRHAASEFNEKKLWTGWQDCGLAQGAAQELAEMCIKNPYPPVDICVSSPMLRCTASCRIIYGCTPDVTVENFKECSLGILEGRPYINLDDDPGYINWISRPHVPIPGGESFSHFRARVRAGYDQLLDAVCGYNTVGVVLHGNVMRVIMNHFANPARLHESWEIPNCGGYCLDLDGRTVRGHSVFKPCD